VAETFKHEYRCKRAQTGDVAPRTFPCTRRSSRPIGSQHCIVSVPFGYVPDDTSHQHCDTALSDVCNDDKQVNSNSPNIGPSIPCLSVTQHRDSRTFRRLSFKCHGLGRCPSDGSPVVGFTITKSRLHEHDCICGAPSWSYSTC
jgi:hypothetical protein